MASTDLAADAPVRAAVAVSAGVAVALQVQLLGARAHGPLRRGMAHVRAGGQRAHGFTAAVCFVGAVCAVGRAVALAQQRHAARAVIAAQRRRGARYRRRGRRGAGGGRRRAHAVAVRFVRAVQAVHARVAAELLRERGGPGCRSYGFATSVTCSVEKNTSRGVYIYKLDSILHASWLKTLTSPSRVEREGSEHGQAGFNFTN